MTSKAISAENLGPISALNFALESPGVTVLVAPNGSGKTILLEAVQAAARGEGKLPLRDRTRRGMVSAFGAQITIGGTCRHTGAFEVTNLEGRFDLAGLVDPRIKTPTAADKARIKALVSLTGANADVNLFRGHPAFDDFDQVVTSASIETEDLVEMAAKIKADYDGAALTRERTADREGGMASALIPPSDLDLDDESDAAVLQNAYNEARDEVIRLSEQKKTAEASKSKFDHAKELLTQLGDNVTCTERDQIADFINRSDTLIQTKKDANKALQAEIVANLADIARTETDIANAKTRLEQVEKNVRLVDASRKVLAESLVPFPDEDDIADAAEELAVAEKAIEKGVLIRAAKADALKSQQHRAAAKLAREKADKYRDAGKATDEVLSNCIQCPQLRVESDGKAARLVTDITERGKSIQYHDLSDGEKWTIAIDIGADQVGAGGLLVISQVGWEGIDGANRLAIHQHAVNRGVYILTAEAASDPEATREIIPTPMPHVEPTVDVPKAQPAQPAQSVKPEPPAKPKTTPKAKAAKPAAVAPPVEATDEDEIPF